MSTKDWCITNGRCFQCLRRIETRDDEAYICIECGGLNRLLFVRKPALWRRVVRAITDVLQE